MRSRAGRPWSGSRAQAPRPLLVRARGPGSAPQREPRAPRPEGNGAEWVPRLLLVCARGPGSAPRQEPRTDLDRRGMEQNGAQGSQAASGPCPRSGSAPRREPRTALDRRSRVWPRASQATPGPCPRPRSAPWRRPRSGGAGSLKPLCPCPRPIPDGARTIVKTERDPGWLAPRREREGGQRREGECLYPVWRSLIPPWPTS